MRVLALAAGIVSLITFSTALAGASTQTTARASVERNVIVVQGTPFFPVMLIDQCTTDAVAHARQLGINAILNEHCADLSSRRQLSMIQSTSLAILPIKSSDVRGSGLLGWTFPDEPENNGWTPASLKRAHPYRRGSSDGLLSFMTTSGGFFKAPYRDSRVSLPAFSEFARMADVAGFDLYPLGHCQQDLTAVYDAQRAFIQLAGQVPTFQWIETGPIKPTYCGGFTMTPAELNAEVWLAIVGGARGIGFFTHTWSPDHRAFDVPLALQHKMQRISALLASVRPGLLSRTVPSGVNSTAVKVLARAADGDNYVFAVNTQRAPIKVQVHVPQLHDAPLQVFGEKRSVNVTNGQFVDNFQPLAVHVYVQRP
ncbi:MAG: putative lipoprotein [Actinomycetia bacterium]|nr:putative lipoprotein [Actinomycetes bacterium]